MRGYRATLVALLSLGLTGCAAVTDLAEVIEPGGEEESAEEEPVAEEPDFDYPPSEISPDEPILCTDEADACAEPGELRWSLPLEGGYFIPDQGAPGNLVSARSRITALQHQSSVVLDENSSVLYYNEDDLVRAIDADTGELLWTTAAGGERPMNVLDDPFWPDSGMQFHDDRLVIALFPGNFFYDSEDFRDSELVNLDPDDGEALQRIPMATPPDRQAPRWDFVDDAVVISSGEQVSAVDLDSGAEVWRADSTEPRTGDPALQRVLIDDTLYQLYGQPPDEEGPELREVRRFDVHTGEELDPVELPPEAQENLELRNLRADGLVPADDMFIDVTTGEIVPEGEEDDDDTAEGGSDYWVSSLDDDIKPDDLDGPMVSYLDLDSITDGDVQGEGPKGVAHTSATWVALSDGGLLVTAACAPDGLYPWDVHTDHFAPTGCAEPRVYALNT